MGSETDRLSKMWEKEPQKEDDYWIGGHARENGEINAPRIWSRPDG